MTSWPEDNCLSVACRFSCFFVLMVLYGAVRCFFWEVGVGGDLALFKSYDKLLLLLTSEQPPNHPQPEPLPVQSALGSVHQESRLYNHQWARKNWPSAFPKSLSARSRPSLIDFDHFIQKGLLAIFSSSSFFFFRGKLCLRGRGVVLTILLCLRC